jgi:hypothetical protein
MILSAKSEPRFVDERGRLKRVSRLFPSHPLRGELAEFLVNQRQQILSGFCIALLDRLKDLRHFAHVSS